MTILLIDDHDSFGRLLRGYLIQLGTTPEVIFSTDLAAGETPQATGVLLASRAPSEPVRAWAAASVPLLGIGSGMHAIAEAYGAELRPTAGAVHGKTTTITHDGTGVFTQVPSPMRVTCYHSFEVAEAHLGEGLLVNARGTDGEIMGLRHHEAPVHGVQFHPEAVLTEHGYQLLGNWLAMAGHPDAAPRGATLAPLISP